MDNLLEFFSFSDPNIRFVTFGAVLLTMSSAIVGSFTFLKKKALVGDAVAHSVLPGVALAFMLSGNKNPLVLIVGAFITGWVSLVVIDLIVNKSKLKEDTAIGLILSVFFGFGIMLLTRIQQSGNAAQSGLDSFLFGKAASLIGSDLLVFSVVAVLLLATVFIFYKELRLISFDPSYGKSIGFPVNRLELLLTTLTVMAVVIGIQAVGVVLMAAMLITPPAAARFWTHSLRTMILLSALFGALSGITGAYISYVAPSMPTGPWIVMVISVIAILSFFIAPERGIIANIMLQRKNRQKILEENILKTFFHLGEQNRSHELFYRESDLVSVRRSLYNNLKKGLKNLKRKSRQLIIQS